MQSPVPYLDEIVTRVVPWLWNEAPQRWTPSVHPTPVSCSCRHQQPSARSSVFFPFPVLFPFFFPDRFKVSIPSLSRDHEALVKQITAPPTPGVGWPAAGNEAGPNYQGLRLVSPRVGYLSESPGSLDKAGASNDQPPAGRMQRETMGIDEGRSCRKNWLGGRKGKKKPTVGCIDLVPHLSASIHGAWSTEGFSLL
ncbi:hypothetical protein BJX76DRAFT_35044 [Aspergillus varians]